MTLVGKNSNNNGSRDDSKRDYKFEKKPVT